MTSLQARIAAFDMSTTLGSRLRGNDKHSSVARYGTEPTSEACQ